MRPSGRIILPLLAAVIACSEPLEPRDIAGFYMLDTINGQRLPVVIGPIPEQTVSVQSGSLTLWEDGTAATIEQRREVRKNVPSEQTYTAELRYDLNGDRIRLGPRTPCPPNALCAELNGVVNGAFVTLQLGQLTYRYRQASDAP